MSQQKKKEFQPISSALIEFCSSTSAHGYAYLAKGATYKRVFWGFLLIIAFGVAIGHLYAMTSKYLEYDYYDVISVRPDITRRFPEVTTCDTAGISDFAASRHEGTRNLIKHSYIIRQYLKAHRINLTGEYTVTDMSTDIRPEYAFANMPANKRSLIGTVFDSLVVSCRFAEQKCSAENFELHANPKYVNCFTFKPKTLNARYDNHLPGPEFGLSLILRGEPTLVTTYYGSVNTLNTNSIHLGIHPPNTMPFLSSNGLHIIPGMSTSIELDQKEFQRLETPYSDCHLDTFIKMNSKKYLMEPAYCFRKCLAHAMYERCRCVSTLIGGVSEDHKEHCMYVDTSNPLNLNVSKLMCELQTLLQWERNETVDCKRCVWNCRETKYGIKVSQAEWPRAAAVKDFIDKYVISKPKDNPVRQYYDHLIEHLGLNHSENIVKFANRKRAGVTLRDIIVKLGAGEEPPVSNMSLSPHVPESLLKSDTLGELHQRWVKESFYRLNIYFSEPFVICHKQVPSFGFEDFFSGVGGVLGLWAGASVLTLLELFSFCGHLFIKSVHQN